MISPALIVITDTQVAPRGVLEARIERILAKAEPGAVAVQLREHELSVRLRLELGRRLKDLCRSHDQYLVVNDRVDLAMLVEADGVHLGDRSMSVQDARLLLGDQTWISRAWHDPAEDLQELVDAVLLSPVLAARKGRPALGIGAVKAVVERLGARAKPPEVYALGGIDAPVVSAVLSAGARGIAVIGAALDGRAPEPLLAELGVLRAGAP